MNVKDIDIREWPDSSGEDDHGRERSSSRMTSRDGRDAQQGDIVKTPRGKAVVLSHTEHDKTLTVTHTNGNDITHYRGDERKQVKVLRRYSRMTPGDQGISAARREGRSKESDMDYDLQYIRERDFDTDTRAKMAKAGTALPDGSFPIANKGDVENAVRAIGRAKDPAKAKAHIKARAKALGCTDCIPDTWESWQTLDGELLCEATFAQSDSHDGVRDKLHQAIHGAVLAGKDMDLDGDDDSPEAKQYGPVSYVRAVHDKHVIYSQGGKTFAHKYSKDEEGDVHLQGAPKEVEPSYQSKKAGPAEESCAESFDFLAESSYDSKTGELPVTIIKPGLSKNNRYYSPELLKRDGKIFEGAKMFLDHATDKEMSQRPEGSVKDWVGSLKGVHAEADGTLKGTAVLIDPAFKQKIQALAEAGLLHTMGVSIRAAALSSDMDMDGKRVKAIESFKAARSVDFVTFAGAGGAAA